MEVDQVLTLEGNYLPEQEVLLEVRSPVWEPRFATFSSPSPGSRPGTMAVTLVDPPPEVNQPPGPQLAWAPGIYTAALLVRRAGKPDVISNSVPFALAARVQVSPKTGSPGNLQVTVKAVPGPGAGQVVLLVLGSREGLLLPLNAADGDERQP